MAHTLPRVVRRKLKRLRSGVDGGQGVQGPQGPTGPQGPSGVTRREDFLSGTTNASGDITFTYPAFSTIPFASIEMVPAPDANTYYRLISLSTTSCTIKTEARSSLNVLGSNLLSATTTNVAGVTIYLKLTEPV